MPTVANPKGPDVEFRLDGTRWIITAGAYRAELPACGCDRPRCSKLRHRGGAGSCRACHGWHAEMVNEYAKAVVDTYRRRPHRLRPVGAPRSAYREKHYVPLPVVVAGPLATRRRVELAIIDVGPLGRVRFPGVYTRIVVRDHLGQVLRDRTCAASWSWTSDLVTWAPEGERWRSDTGPAALLFDNAAAAQAWLAATGGATIAPGRGLKHLRLDDVPLEPYR